MLADYPQYILLIGIVTVIGMIIVLRMHAFIALISAAMLVSLLSPGALSDKISRVAAAFGSSAGSIGVVIALAAVIGKCMMDSGAADKIVRTFMGWLGEKRAAVALMSSGYVLSVPVFFDTVFYLLVPLARSVYKRTGKNYVKYILAITAGGAVTHTLVPPTPGPLLMASNLNIDVGMMILVGAIIGLPTAIAGLLCAGLIDRLMPLPMRSLGAEPEPEALSDEQLPSFFLSVLPVLLPVLMISTDTVLTTIANAEYAARFEVEDVNDWPAFAARLSADGATGAPPSFGGRVMTVLEETENEQLNAAREMIDAGQVTTADQQATVVAALNQLLGRKKLYEDETTPRAELPGDAVSLLGQNRDRMNAADVERLNRLLFEATYPNLIDGHEWNTPLRQAANFSSLLGNANLALLLSTAIAMGVLFRQRKLTRREMANTLEISLMSGGVIILITSGGGAFGAMLAEAGIGGWIQEKFDVAGSGGGISYLLLGFAIAVVLKIAQGSSTVAMITASGMLTGIASPDILGFHPVLLATAIGSGSLVGSWMNDSGFWIFAKMGGLTEAEALKSWTILLAVLGLVGMGVTLLVALVWQSAM